MSTIILSFDCFLIYHLVIALFSFQGSTKEFSIETSFYKLFESVGGDEENRTPDPLLARQVLSQLSYTPIGFLVMFWWA